MGLARLSLIAPTLLAGYWQDEAATAQVMRGGWMKTGDIGRFDAAGFLVLEGRIKDIIKLGGLTVIATEIESVFMEHPGISDAAVVGVADERWGEAVHAFVTLSPGAAARSLGGLQATQGYSYRAGAAADRYRQGGTAHDTCPGDCIPQ
jgi:acyl-CoA synthetase (AMP-forming)/AMP-acid ligase II